MIFKERPSDRKYKNCTTPPEIIFKKEPMAKWGEYKASGICECCDTQRTNSEYLILPANAWGRKDEKGNHLSLYCKHCMYEIVKHYIVEDPDHSTYKALYRMCMMLNVYYDNALAHKVIEETRVFEDGTIIPEQISWLELYIRAVIDDENIQPKTFWDSDNFIFEDVLKYQRTIGALSEQAQEERSQVISLYKWDPFMDIEPVEDRPKLYNDLITMYTEDMAENLPKARAAIEIVRAYYRIDKDNQALNQLQMSSDSMIENERSIKALTEQKTKELNAIAQLSKDHGFAERYATAKSKGTGTITAVVRDMDKLGYDKGAVNKFDIDTFGAMKQVQDYSAESMFKQLAFTGDVYADMVKQQGVIIQEMQSTIESLQEDLRIHKELELRQELVEQLHLILQEKGIDEQEIKKIIQKELEYVPLNPDTVTFSKQGENK